MSKRSKENKIMNKIIQNCESLGINTKIYLFCLLAGFYINKDIEIPLTNSCIILNFLNFMLFIFSIIDNFWGNFKKRD